MLFAVVRLDADASGVAIHDEIEQRTGRDVSPGAIYTTLGRLEERGLVTSTVVRRHPHVWAGLASTTRCGPPAPGRCASPTTASQALAVGLLPKLSELAKGR